MLSIAIPKILQSKKRTDAACRGGGFLRSGNADRGGKRTERRNYGRATAASPAGKGQFICRTRGRHRKNCCAEAPEIIKKERHGCVLPRHENMDIEKAPRRNALYFRRIQYNKKLNEKTPPEHP